MVTDGETFTQWKQLYTSIPQRLLGRGDTELRRAVIVGSANIKILTVTEFYSLNLTVRQCVEESIDR